MALTALQAVTGDITREFDITRHLLARIPDEHLAWKPHEKSMSLMDLAEHITRLLFFYLETIEKDELDAAAMAPRLPQPTSADILASFDAQREQVDTALAALSEADLDRTWTFRHGDHQIFSMPKAEVLRIWCTNHMVHHRGQLSVYLRLLDIPLPWMYGPTADER